MASYFEHLEHFSVARRALCTFYLEMTEIPKPSIQVNIGDFSLKLRALKKAMGAKNNVPIAEALGVSTKSVGDWIRETSEPRLQRRRPLEKKIEELMLKIAVEKDNPPAAVSQPEALSPPSDGFPDGPPEDTEPEDAPEPEKPAVRSLLPDDRRWDV